MVIPFFPILSFRARRRGILSQVLLFKRRALENKALVRSMSSSLVLRLAFTLSMALDPSSVCLQQTSSGWQKETWLLGMTKEDVFLSSMFILFVIPNPIATGWGISSRVVLFKRRALFFFVIPTPVATGWGISSRVVLFMRRATWELGLRTFNFTFLHFMARHYGINGLRSLVTSFLGMTKKKECSSGWQKETWLLGMTKRSVNEKRKTVLRMTKKVLFKFNISVYLHCPARA